MINIVNTLCISMLCGSLIPLLGSLIRTVVAYKGHKKLKKEIKEGGYYEIEKIDEIIATQREILEILEDIENTKRSKDLTIEKEKLEKRKKELEDNFLAILQTTESKKI